MLNAQLSVSVFRRTLRAFRVPPARIPFRKKRRKRPLATSAWWRGSSGRTRCGSCPGSRGRAPSTCSRGRRKGYALPSYHLEITTVGLMSFHSERFKGLHARLVLKLSPHCISESTSSTLDTLRGQVKSEDTYFYLSQQLWKTYSDIVTFQHSPPPLLFSTLGPCSTSLQTPQ